MKRNVLVDSSYLFALNYTKDSCHKQAQSIQTDILKPTDRLLLGMNIYTEILTLISQRLNKDRALTLLKHLNTSFELINPTEDTYIKADFYFKKISSKNISYSDCISFALMEEYGIMHVLSFDEHFKQQGFNRLGIDA